MYPNRHKFIPILLPFICLFSILGNGQNQRLYEHIKASPLSEFALTKGWPRYNGPSDDASSPETKLLKDWGKNGPTLVWESKKGEGYASPAISKGILILFYRENGMETIEGVNAENGKRRWVYQYPVKYKDRYGYSNGPRASPVIDGNHIFCHGVTSWLTCLDLKTGKLIWKRDLRKEFEIPDYFFGKGSNPIVYQEFVIVNVGGSKNRCVVGFNKKTGKTEWITKDSWGASYSSPVITKLHDTDVCLVFTGGESRPPEGGLLVIRPENGEKLARFSWRSSRYESANAVPPIPLGDNHVFLSECYEKGSVVLEFKKDFSHSIVWTNKNINIHWMTPVLKDGTMYGIAGRHQQGAETFCLDPLSGKVHWKEPIFWNETINDRKTRIGLFRGAILKLEDGFICLSELGSLLKINFSPKGWEIQNKAQLFFAPGTWTLPALSNGLLYIMQNETDRITGKQPRILCFDLRAK
jgi:outer membrane protein assembly factor BamB